MTRLRRMAGLMLGTFLALSSSGARGAPLEGSYPVKNKAFGLDHYAFPATGGKVFVFHHFRVQVC